MNAHHRIEEWFRRIEQSYGRMTREDVCFLMVQVRHLIEASNTPEKYRVAAFYADWTVHSALDRAPVCFEILRDITLILVDNFNPTRPDLTREISRIIGFPQLRSELMNIFRDNKLPIMIFDYYENWKNFIMFLLWFLADQPIRFPEKPTGQAKKIQDEIFALQRPYNIIVEALAVVKNDGGYHWVLTVSGDKKISIIGPVEIAESKDAFSIPPQIG